MMFIPLQRKLWRNLKSFHDIFGQLYIKLLGSIALLNA